MRAVEISEATEPLARYARGLRRNPVLLTRKGKPFAVLVTLDGIDRDGTALSTSPAFMKIIERSRKSLRAGKGLTLAEVEARLK